MDRRSQATPVEHDRRYAADRRGDARARALLGGRVLYGPGYRLQLEVRLRDVSDHGARAILPEAEACPPVGVLLVPRTGMAYRYEVAWSRGGQAGLAFTHAWDLQGPDLPDEAKALRRLWVELTLR